MASAELPALLALEPGVCRGHMRVPSDWPWAEESSHLFVLGAAHAGHEDDLTVGDWVAIGKTIDLTDKRLLTWKARLRGALTNDTWQFQVYVGDFLYSHTDIVPRRTVDLSDMIANVAMVDGEADVTFVLRLRALAGGGTSRRIEIPGVLLDLVETAAEADDILVVNRAPEPGETRVPTGASIRIEVAFTDPEAATHTLTSSRLKVWVNDDPGTDGSTEVLAYNAGAAAAGYSASFVTEARPWVSRLTLTRTAAWPTGGNVRVRVAVLNEAGAVTLVEETYTFTADEPFGIVFAKPKSPNVIAVRFNRPYFTADGSALDPAAYTLQNPTPLPAMDTTVSAVETVLDPSGAPNPRTLLLTTEDPLSPKATYELVLAETVRDLDRNPPGSTPGTVTPFASSVEGRDFDLYKMLPRSNRQADETGDLQSFISAKQELVDLLLAVIDDFPRQFDPDTADRAFIEWMLADRGNPFTIVLSDRDAARLALELSSALKKKGTSVGIEDVVNFLLDVPDLNPVVWTNTVATGQLGSTFRLHHSRLGGGTLREKLGFYISVDKNLDEVGTDPVSGQPLYDEQVGPARRATVRFIAAYMKWGPTYLKRIIEPARPALPAEAADADRFDLIAT